MRRVVITGVGVASPIGNSYAEVARALQEGRHGIATQPTFARHPEMLTGLGAAVELDLQRRWSRKQVRAMGRVARLAYYATEQALEQSGLEATDLQSGRLGLAFGSTHGSTDEWERFALTLEKPNALLGLGSNAYLKFATHTCAMNLAVALGIRGRILTTCAACVSGSQAIGQGYEAIKFGLQDVMICGGAEELHYISTGVFDVLQATSTHYNEQPGQSSRPFDKSRDGLVVGEGSGAVILEEYEHAKARGAEILGELKGYGTSCDGTHITAPSSEGMATAMRSALADAGVTAEEVGYINAHATATDVGDIAESKATESVFGSRTPVSSTKGATGHTMGACGAIETIFSLAMLREGFMAPNRNLVEVDPRCAPLNYLREVQSLSGRIVMNNNFAFGGINTSIVLGA